jgi:hypothetical protein
LPRSSRAGSTPSRASQLPPDAVASDYGSGTGFVAGVVLGRIAGREAAKLAAESA